MPPDSAFHIPSSPVAALGTITLLIAFIVAAYAGAAGIIGQKTNRPGLVTSSLYSMWAFTALMCFASALIIYAFLSHDFRLKYVAHYSDTTMPLFYLITSYWGGLDGSLMFWVWVLSMFSAVALFVNRHRHRDMIGYVIATIAAVALFFLALLLYSKNPFTTFLTAPPGEGKGLNPLLQNYWMVIHPPSLYTGYVGMTIPFAFCVGALASGRLDDSWLHSIRVWVLIPWFFLSFGLILGGLWAYEELGWGGYWAWDPVENAGLIPWFTATAFLHSVMIQERRGMLKVWNVVLLITTFFLTIFGTFMTRSGVVQSVHAFGQDNELAMLFLIFMCVILTVSLGLLIYRLPALRSVNTFESFISREVAFLLNNILLLICAFFVLFATMFPTISEYVMHQRITVGPPFFNRFMVPFGLALLVLTGVGPLLAWRVTTTRRLIEQFFLPVVAMVGTLVALAIWVPRSRVLSPLFSGQVQLPLALINYGFVAFVVVSLAQEFVRGAMVRRAQTGADWFTSLIGVIVTKRRKYGGYIIHVGIAIMFVGFAGKAYQTEKSVTLSKSGEKFTVDAYTFRYDDLAITGNDNRDMYTARVSVLDAKSGVKLWDMYPARWHYTTGEQQTTTEVDIHRSMPRDVYLVLNGFDPQSKQANFTVYMNPMVNFVWFGFGWLFVGFMVCLIPGEAIMALRPKRRGPLVKAGEVMTILALVGGITFGMVKLAKADTAPMQTQGMHDVDPSNLMDVDRAPPVAQKLFNNLVCLCGGCARESLHDCPCGSALQERGRILSMIAGKDMSTPEKQQAVYDEVVAAYVSRFGGNHVLRVPPNSGFNILAWAVPYAAFGGALVLIIFAVRGWVKRGKNAASAERVANKPAMAAPESIYDEKLDEELDDLD